MWIDIIVTKSWDNGNYESLVVGKCVDKGICNSAVHSQDFAIAAGYFLITVMAGRVARPNDKINGVLQVGRNPIEGRINQRQRGVAVGCLSAINSSWAMASVASHVLFRGCVGFVILVGMKIYGRYKTLAFKRILKYDKMVVWWYDGHIEDHIYTCYMEESAVQLALSCRLATIADWLQDKLGVGSWRAYDEPRQ